MLSAICWLNTRLEIKKFKKLGNYREISNMEKHVQLPKLNGKNLKIGIVCAQWHAEMIQALKRQCTQALRDSGVKEKNIFTIDVPGSYELVYGAKALIEKYRCDAVIPLGVLIKGETMHFEYIADAVGQGIMRLNLDSGVPVIFGILTCLSKKQAEERSLGDKSHGYNWGLSAVEMALLKKRA